MNRNIGAQTLTGSLIAQKEITAATRSMKRPKYAHSFTRAEVQRLKDRPGAQSVVVSYISIGEASDYRDHWQDNWTTYTDPDQRAAGELTEHAPKWLGAWNEQYGACGSLFDIPRDPRLHHRCEVVGGVLAQETGDLVRTYLTSRR